MDLRIISIGALAAHPLWNERVPVRTGHATTTLIRVRAGRAGGGAASSAASAGSPGGAGAGAGSEIRILVDPGLPEQIIVARLAERANLTPADITHVFLTSFQPDTTRGITAFDDAEWLIHEPEREAVGAALALRLKDLIASGEPSDEERRLREALERDVAILRRCTPAPDHVAPGVDLFPLPGVTPGCCGLLAQTPTSTTLICGDAVPTIEHLEQGQVLPRATDVGQARESFAEAIEIADVLVLGRDNAINNPTKRGF